MVRFPVGVNVVPGLIQSFYFRKNGRIPRRAWACLSSSLLPGYEMYSLSNHRYSWRFFECVGVPCVIFSVTRFYFAVTFAARAQGNFPVLAFWGTNGVSFSIDSRMRDAHDTQRG